MNVDDLLNRGIYLFQTHTLIVVSFIAVIVFLILFRRKSTYRMIAILLVLVFLFYMATLIGGMTSTSRTQKDQMVQKTPKLIHQTKE